MTSRGRRWENQWSVTMATGRDHGNQRVAMATAPVRPTAPNLPSLRLLRRRGRPSPPLDLWMIFFWIIHFQIFFSSFDSLTLKELFLPVAGWNGRRYEEFLLNYRPFISRFQMVGGLLWSCSEVALKVSLKLHWSCTEVALKLQWNWTGTALETLLRKAENLGGLILWKWRPASDNCTETAPVRHWNTTAWALMQKIRLIPRWSDPGGGREEGGG